MTLKTLGLQLQNKLTAKQLEDAIDGCAKEPIHIPGSIQPQGLMIILDENFTIQKISDNAQEYLDAKANELIGKQLSDFLTDEKIIELKSLTSEGALNPIRSTNLRFESSPQNNKSFDAIIHKSRRYFVLELEPSVGKERSAVQQDLYQEVMGFSVYLQRVNNSQTLYDYVTNQIRRIAGFARVKLYKFDKDWNGLVVAESKASHMPSYKGMSFPHSDIPKQARNLYAKNYLRLIPDVSYEPVKIIPDDLDENNEPVDLSFSTLRSVSPVHMQYLANMGVQSSMSVSIMQNDRLWGLIACHHDTPLHVSYNIRMVCELFGHTFSAYLSSLEAAEEISEERKKEAFVKELSGYLTPDRSLVSSLKERYDLILKSVEADGVIIYLNGKYFAFGLLPEMGFADKLIRWLESNHDGHIFVSNSISRDTDLNTQGQSMASGVLAIPVSAKMTDYVMWFREEQIEKVNWAGKPEKDIAKTDARYHLTPRASFKRWQEDVRGFSKPWTPADIKLASNVGKMLLAKRYEDTLRQKNEDVNTILNNSNAIIYILDSEGNILNMNESAQYTLNLEHEEFIGRHFRTLFDDELADLIQEQYRAVIQQQISMTFEQSFNHKQQKYHFISVCFPLYDSNSDIYAICVMSTDVTQMKETEEQLVRSNKELEQMAFIASHDLQEPLRMIGTFSELINDKYGSQFDEDAQKYMQFTLDSTQRMKNLITDLLQYSRVSNDTKNIPLIDTKEECKTLFDGLKLMYEGQGATIKFAKNMPSIYMTPEHFGCLIQNLVGNGIKYKHPDRSPEVWVKVADKKSEWLFSIQDNGIGIEDKHNDKIFEIFKRLHARDEYGGTGIGLALCKRVVEKYNGKIWLESIVGVGSTFHFTVPKKKTTS